MLPDTPVSQLPSATLPLSGAEVAILNQNGRTCVAPIGDFPPLVNISVSGDISGSGPAGALVLTLPNINSNVTGPYNNITVNAKGQITAATVQNVTMTMTGDVVGSNSGWPSINVSMTLPNINSNVGTYNSITVNAKGQVTSASNITLPVIIGPTTFDYTSSIATLIGTTPNNGRHFLPTNIIFSIDTVGNNVSPGASTINVGFTPSIYLDIISEVLDPNFKYPNLANNNIISGILNPCPPNTGIYAMMNNPVYGGIMTGKVTIIGINT